MRVTFALILCSSFVYSSEDAETKEENTKENEEEEHDAHKRSKKKKKLHDEGMYHYQQPVAK